MTEYEANGMGIHYSNDSTTPFTGHRLYLLTYGTIRDIIAKYFASRFPLFSFSLTLIILMSFALKAQAGQDITIDFVINGNVFGNSNAPDYHCQPGTVCITEVVEPNGNVIRVTSGTINNGSAYGGFGHDSTANNNAAILSGGNIQYSLFGGGSNIYSAQSSPLTSSGNTVTVSGGTVHNNVFGASISVYYASSAVDIFASLNSVIIDTASTFDNIGDIAGVDVGHYGSGTVNAEYNSINYINGASGSDSIYGASVYLVDGTAATTHNTVNIGGGNLNQNSLFYIMGALAQVSSGSGVSDFNVVNITGGIINGKPNFAIYGGYWQGYGAGAIGSAKGNAVNVSGGEINGDIFGGTGVSNSVSNAGEAIGNFVNISGGAINGSVFGGEGYNFDPSGVATATGNEVTISGAPTFGANSEIYGGTAYGQGDDVTGNTLNFQTSGVTVKGIYNFARLNFLLPANAANGATILTVTDRAEVTYATVEVAVAGASSPLGPGDEVILIDATVLDGAPLNSQTSGFGAQGVSLVYEFELLQSGNQLKAVVRKAAVNERVKALSEGFVAALGLIARGSDLVEGQGLASATLAVARGASLQGVNWVPFAALSANRERLESGSHVDSSGFAVVAGIAKGFTVGSVRLAIGPFFEYGHGSYDTYNSFAASPAVHGDGRANYAGGGALARLELPHGPGALHFELSGRIGRLRNEYHSADLTSLTGIAASYDYSGTYYGYHFGAGYLWRASAKTSLDLSAKYFWTRQEGKEATLATGEKASFDAAESSRLRLGARLARDFSDKARVYVGAAWERELAGEARAYYWGLPVKAPSLKGDAGIGEVGVTLSPTDGGAFSLDFGVQGYVGQRRGATGSLRLQFEF